MTIHTVPFDPGLQPERTVLAWQRTSLAVAVINLGVIRVAGQLGEFYVWCGASGIVLAIIAWMWAGLRYARTNRDLRESGSVPRTAIPVLLATIATVTAGILGAWFVADVA